MTLHSGKRHEERRGVPPAGMGGMHAVVDAAAMLESGISGSLGISATCCGSRVSSPRFISRKADGPRLVPEAYKTVGPGCETGAAKQALLFPNPGPS